MTSCAIRFGSRLGYHLGTTSIRFDPSKCSTSTLPRIESLFISRSMASGRNHFVTKGSKTVGILNISITMWILVLRLLITLKNPKFALKVGPNYSCSDEFLYRVELQKKYVT